MWGWVQVPLSQLEYEKNLKLQQPNGGESAVGPEKINPSSLNPLVLGVSLQKHAQEPRKPVFHTQ